MLDFVHLSSGMMNPGLCHANSCCCTIVEGLADISFHHHQYHHVVLGWVLVLLLAYAGPIMSQPFIILVVSVILNAGWILKACGVCLHGIEFLRTQWPF